MYSIKYMLNLTIEKKKKKKKKKLFLFLKLHLSFLNEYIHICIYTIW